MKIETLRWVVMSKILRVFRHWCRETKGAVLVEFAVVCLVFLLIVAGIMDLGHAFFMKQVVTNASREGARYGAAYQEYNVNGTLTRKPPVNYAPTIEQQVKTYLSKTGLPSDANPQVSMPTMVPDGYNTGQKNAPLAVQVTATKTWFILDNFIPGLGESVTLSAETVMRCE
jgi:Flp pilus assembly protein TadG